MVGYPPYQNIESKEVIAMKRSYWCKINGRWLLTAGLLATLSLAGCSGSGGPAGSAGDSGTPAATADPGAPAVAVGSPGTTGAAVVNPEVPATSVTAVNPATGTTTV